MQFKLDRWRKPLGLVAKAIVSGLVVSLVLSRVDLAGVRTCFAVVSGPKLVLAMGAFLLVPAFGGLRWWLALRGLGERARLSDITMLFSAASVVGQMLPSVAGDGMRVWLAARAGHGIRAALHSVFLERAFMVLAVLAMAMVTAPLLAARTGYDWPIWPAGGLFLFGLAGFAVLITADRAPRFPARLRPWRILAGEAAAARRLIMSRWGAFLAGSSLIANVYFALAAYLLGCALEVRATAWDMISVMPAVTLATTLPISLGGWGLREGVFVLLLSRIGVPVAEALALSLLFGLFGIASGLPGLLACVFGWCRIARVLPTGSAARKEAAAAISLAS